MALSAIVLAGGGRDAVCALDPQAPNKAFVAVAGVTLVERTLAALRDVPRIERIIVVAPASTEGHPALARAGAHRPGGARMLDSLRSGLSGLPADELALVTASDLPMLSRAALDQFLDIALASNADLVYACVERSVHEARFPEIPHTWARLRDGTFCGAGCIAIRPRVLPALERILDRLGAARKNPLALAGVFGWDVLARYAAGLLTIRAVEKRASELLGAPARAAVCTHAEIAVNVDRPGDIALAEAALARSEGLDARPDGNLTRMTTQERKRCDNLACLCEVPASENICAPFCDSPEARDSHETVCRCGHAVCEDVSERQLHGEAGKESLN